MIEAGSEIHARSSSFATALHVAARQNLKTICQAQFAFNISIPDSALQSLIGEGVDLDCVDDVGKTPLHYASERNSIGAAKVRSLSRFVETDGFVYRHWLKQVLI